MAWRLAIYGGLYRNNYYLSILRILSTFDIVVYLVLGQVIGGGATSSARNFSPEYGSAVGMTGNIIQRTIKMKIGSSSFPV